MTQIIRVEKTAQEGTDYWCVGVIAVPRAGFNGPVVLTQSDITGLITLAIYNPASSTPIYSTSFSKTLSQDGVLEAVHALTVDSRELPPVGHSFAFQIRQADVGAGVMKGGRRYTHVFTFPTARDGNVPAIFVVDVRALH